MGELTWKVLGENLKYSYHVGTVVSLEKRVNDRGEKYNSIRLPRGNGRRPDARFQGPGLGPVLVRVPEAQRVTRGGEGSQV